MKLLNVVETVNRNENLPASEAVKLLQWQAVQQLKKNRKIENVLIVKLITWQHARLCNYHII
jgi:hypothetical protein